MEFEEAEKILSWRDMKTGVYIFVHKEVRGMNKWMRPIRVVTPKEKIEGRTTKYYAPASLHYALENRPKTLWIKYEGVKTSENGYQYPVFKYI